MRLPFCKCGTAPSQTSPPIDYKPLSLITVNLSPTLWRTGVPDTASIIAEPPPIHPPKTDEQNAYIEPSWTRHARCLYRARRPRNSGTSSALHRHTSPTSWRRHPCKAEPHSSFGSAANPPCHTYARSAAAHSHLSLQRSQNPSPALVPVF